MNLAIIGGTGAVDLFETDRPAAITTPFGAPSDRPRRIRLGDEDCWFLARHGAPHRIPPHKVNYRANIHALKTLGVEAVLAVNAVGGVTERAAAGKLLIPDQLLDFTWGRAHTFSDGGSAPLQHIDFTHPFDGRLREALCRASEKKVPDAVVGGCIGVTQGPRLETAAEVRYLARLGCDVVGMGDGRAAGGGHCVAEDGGVLPGLEHQLGGPVDRLSRQARGGRAGEALLDARVGERLDEHVDVGRAAAREARHGVHERLGHLLDGPDGFEDVEAQRDLVVVGVPAGRQGRGPLVDEGRRVGHGAQDGDAAAEVLLERVGRHARQHRDQERLARVDLADLVEHVERDFAGAFADRGVGASGVDGLAHYLLLVDRLGEEATWVGPEKAQAQYDRSVKSIRDAIGLLE